MKKYMFVISIMLCSFSPLFGMELDSKIFVAGHNGLVGSALMRKLLKEGYTNIITRSSKELDLCNQAEVNRFFEEERPEYVFLSAAKVGGIIANMTYPADFIYNNLMISVNVIHAAYNYGVKKLLFLGSSCIYPRDCEQPILEEYLLSGYLEKTNEPYAVAKIAGIKICQSYNKQYGAKFISCMPTNLYGINDNFDLQNSHVLPALLSKFVTAKETNASQVTVWGTGNALREFLYVEDLASALFFLMENYDGDEIVNVGTGVDISIGDLARLMKKVVGYEGEIIFDTTKPDGTPRKLLNVNKLAGLGWKAETSLEEGLEKTLEWYLANRYKTRQ